jgi:hypothetical protein
LGGTGLFLPRSVKLYGTSSRVQSIFNAESTHTVGVSVMDAGVASVIEGAAVGVITCTVGDGINVGASGGVGCGLQAERINKINPMNWNFFIRYFPLKIL